MITVVVWVLVVSQFGSYGDTITVVDGIASRTNCEALGRLISDQARSRTTTHCYAVRKAKP